MGRQNLHDPSTYRRKPKKMKKGGKKKSAKQKYGNGTTYTDSKGKKHKRIAHPGTARGHAYCARSSGQKSKDGTKSAKLRQRRKDWGCKGKRSYKK